MSDTLQRNGRSNGHGGNRGFLGDLWHRLTKVLKGRNGDSSWRETIEESGIVPTHFSGAPIDLDVHSIPARPEQQGRPAQPQHLHLDLRFLVHAPPGAIEVVSDESLDLRWFAVSQLEGIRADDSLRRLFRIAFGA